jgi:transcriptional regulator with XRE-family HTH domain
MAPTIGTRVRTERELRGWTQEQLEEKTGVPVRTIQRVEADDRSPALATLSRLAGTFGTDVSRLLTGLDLDALTDLADACSCPVCGAPLVERVFVDHVYGDCEFETFECGSTRGWRYRLCPKDPAFPAFSDYELRIDDDGSGNYLCSARGQTNAARSVELPHGYAATEAEARRQVEWQYVAAKEGRASADATLGPLWPGLQ